jgi:uncharacterized protein (TIGR03437 family)
MQLKGANPAAEPIKLDRSSATANYLMGNDPSRWRLAVPSFQRVGYREVYPGIDLVYYGAEGRLEYDFRVEAAADPQAIRMVYSGAAGIRVDVQGALILRTANGEIRQQEPRAYQDVNGVRRAVLAHYRLRKNEVGFELGRYDHSRPLVLDPVLSFATYLGGSRSDGGDAIAVDAAGNIYVAGTTYSSDFPVTRDVIQTTKLNTVAPDLFISKLDPKGTVIFTTYLGGNSGELLGGLAVDAASNIYIGAATDSTNLPVSDGVYQQYNRGGYLGFDVYVAKLDPTGSRLVFGTYIGGSDDDLLLALTIDKSNAVYLAGTTASTNFPTTVNAYQKNNKFLSSFVTKLSSDGTQLNYSTLVGGSGTDVPYAIKIDSSGNAYVAGKTGSKDFPTTAGAFQTVNHGGSTDGTDAFLFKLNLLGSQLIYSTLLGGSGDDSAVGLSLDSSGNAYVAGYTYSADFPVTKGVLQLVLLGPSDAFVTKVDPTGASVVFSTFLGGSRSDGAVAIFLDGPGAIYVAGSTMSSNFPVLAPFQTALAGGADGYAVKLDPAGSKILQGSLIGGSADDNVVAAAIDGAGNVYLTGSTASTDLPINRTAPQARYQGGATDSFIAKIDFADANLNLQVSPDKLVFQGTVNTPLSIQTLTVAGVGTSLVGWKAVVSAGGAWLSIIPQSGSGSGPITVSVNPTGLGAGSYQGSIGFTNQITGAQMTIPVTLTLLLPVATGGQILSNGVLNAASYQGGPVAPGEMITIFGSGIGPASPTGWSITQDGTFANTLAETRVLFDGVPAPLLYVSAAQVSAIVPYEVAGASTQLQVEYKAVKSNALTLPVAACSPAIFTANSSGAGQAGATNLDNTYNSMDNPAEKGSVITFFGTGEGQTDPPGADGKLAVATYPKPLLPVSVLIGGVSADILYYGAAPTAVAGMLQVNARIPDTLASGSQSLILQIGNCTSRDGVTVAVK